MAEVVFKDLLKSHGLNTNHWLVKSAGLHAIANLPAVPIVQEISRKLGYDLSHHLSTMLSMGMMNSFNLVLVMEICQLQQIKQFYPTQAHKTYLLSVMAGLEKDIIDLFGTSLDFHQETLLEIKKYLLAGFHKIYKLASK